MSVKVMNFFSFFFFLFTTNFLEGLVVWACRLRGGKEEDVLTFPAVRAPCILTCSGAASSWRTVSRGRLCLAALKLHGQAWKQAAQEYSSPGLLLRA
jgi:hypothetical protein